MPASCDSIIEGQAATSMSGYSTQSDDGDALSTCESDSNQTITPIEDDTLSTDHSLSNRSRQLLDPTIVSGLIRNSSPVPASFYDSKASQLIVRLWGLRCPYALCDIDVPKALRGIATHLTSDQCVLLCIGSWLFDTNPDMVHIWEFYEFTFHRKRYSNQEQQKIFRLMEGKFVTSLSIEGMISLWDTLLATINKHVNDALTNMQYSLCTCAVEQPHSFHDLRESIQMLEGKDNLTVSEIAKYAFIAHNGLRVLDLIDKDNTRLLQHPLVDRCHRTVLKSLRVRGIEKSTELKCAMEYETAYEVRESLLENGIPSKFSL